MNNRITITTKGVTVENLHGAEAIVNVSKGDTVTEETVFPNAVKHFELTRDTTITIADREFVEAEAATEGDKSND